MMMILSTVTVFAASYLAGSVNFAIVLFRLLGRDDPRGRFSGNAGTTNVYRQAGILWAAAVLFMDIARAVIVAWGAGALLHPAAVPWACLFLVAGNRFPLFHGFRGGKGVANYLGFTFFISPAAGALSCAAWVVAYGISRVPFIASFVMIAVLAGGTMARYSGHPAAIAGAVVTALFVALNHRTNVREYFVNGKGRHAVRDRDREDE
jgi:glycerol-3-phosphate acyltransferase PlsY